MPALLDLNWKPSADESTLPTGVYPGRAPAVYRNDTYSITLRLWNDEEGTDPYTPEGTLTAEIRPARLAAGATVADPIVEFDVEVDGNEVSLTLTRAQAAIVPDAAYWDLQEVLAGDVARTWFTGKVKGWGDVTR